VDIARLYSTYNAAAEPFSKARKAHE
jgi:hypothetical protein